MSRKLFMLGIIVTFISTLHYLRDHTGQSSLFVLCLHEDEDSFWTFIIHCLGLL